MVMKVQVDPTGEFQREFRRINKKVGDLTIPLRSISRRWYQSNKSIFALRGEGQYRQLSQKYSDRKERQLGFIFPLLRGANRRIEGGITDPKSKYSFNAIANKNTLILGVRQTSDFPYARAIHAGSQKQNIPARPYLFTGVEQVRPKGHQKSLEIYLSILSKYMLQVTEGKGP